MQSFVKMVSYLSLRPMVYLYSHEVQSYWLIHLPALLKLTDNHIRSRSWQASIATSRCGIQNKFANEDRVDVPLPILVICNTVTASWHASDLMVGEDVDEQRKKRKQSHRPLTGFHRAPRAVIKCPAVPFNLRTALLCSVFSFLGQRLSWVL